MSNIETRKLTFVQQGMQLYLYDVKKVWYNFKLAKDNCCPKDASLCKMISLVRLKEVDSSLYSSFEETMLREVHDIGTLYVRILVS
jgi:hypothetical protein